MQQKAIESQLSAIGEQFSAGALSIAISSYVDAEASRLKNLFGDERKVLAEVYSFTDDRGNPDIIKFRDAIKRCIECGIRVLVAYVAGDDGLPVVLSSGMGLNENGRVNARNMDRAHWSVIDGFDEHDNMLTIFQGHHRNGARVHLKDVFLSNCMLGDRFNWSNFQSQNSGPAVDTVAGRRADFFTDVYEMSEEDNLEEIVDLRGKIILMGFKASKKDTARKK